jgi:hypothetical protein
MTNGPLQRSWGSDVLFSLFELSLQSEAVNELVGRRALYSGI